MIERKTYSLNTVNPEWKALSLRLYRATGYKILVCEDQTMRERRGRSHVTRTVTNFQLERDTEMPHYAELVKLENELKLTMEKRDTVIQMAYQREMRGAGGKSLGSSILEVFGAVIGLLSLIIFIVTITSKAPFIEMIIPLLGGIVGTALGIFMFMKGYNISEKMKDNSAIKDAGKLEMDHIMQLIEQGEKLQNY